MCSATSLPHFKLEKINLIVCTVLGLFTMYYGTAQTHHTYSISFENAEHHEAKVSAIFDHLEHKVLQLRMSRTSPGRYALHEFAKNVYEVTALNGKGDTLEVTRPNPYQWNVANHGGTVILSYKLYGNHGDGTYAQIDESHAHLNIPATFMYAKHYENRPIQITIHPRKDLKWHIATQLKYIEKNDYFAPNLQYFMDSPIELSNHYKKSFIVELNGQKQKINLALHHQGSDQEGDQYFENIKKIVLEQEKVFGELPQFDFNEYTFIACYMPQVDGDGMEHRNSTILTSTTPLNKGGFKRNIGTVSHEFFHSWNVERIRPLSLEPFNFEKANMSGELWFAEGFTSYYTKLILCRAGIISQEAYVNGLAGALNYVWNSPARNYFNPIEMSYQAPFVDAAKSVDPVNRENTFISYYSYGSVLGLALDLSLRSLNSDKNLDGLMALIWQNYGKTEQSYTIKDIETMLSAYAGADFATGFFNNYIYQSKMPNYKALFDYVGVSFGQNDLNKSRLGAYVDSKNNHWVIVNNPYINGAAYKAGLTQGDEIISINNIKLDQVNTPNSILSSIKPGEKAVVKYQRFGIENTTTIILKGNKAYQTTITKKASRDQVNHRNQWLK